MDIKSYQYKLYCGMFFSYIAMLFILKKTHSPLIVTAILLSGYLWFKYGYIFKPYDKDVEEMLNKNKNRRLNK